MEDNLGFSKVSVCRSIYVVHNLTITIVSTDFFMSQSGMLAIKAFTIVRVL